MWALQQMVMMGLAKMKQTIQMEMVYHTGEYVTFKWTCAVFQVDFHYHGLILPRLYQCVLLKV